MRVMVTAEFLDYYRKITETLHSLAGKHFDLAISTFGISFFPPSFSLLLTSVSEFVPAVLFLS